MSNFKRRKPRRKVRCVLCTPHRKGNSLKEAAAQKLRELAGRKDA